MVGIKSLGRPCGEAAVAGALDPKQMKRMAFCERYWGAVADSNVMVTGTLSP
jgi:hypothetical protein